METMKHSEIISEIKKYDNLSSSSHISKPRMSGLNIIKIYFNDKKSANDVYNKLPLGSDLKRISKSARGLVEERKDRSEKFGKYSIAVYENYKFKNEE